MGSRNRKLKLSEVLSKFAEGNEELFDLSEVNKDAEDSIHFNWYSFH